MNTVVMLLLLLNAAHTEPVSASVSNVSAATCAAYERASESDNGATVVVCETRSEVQHDLTGGHCAINPVKPIGNDGETLYICNNPE
jgi:hypothetical protein